MEDKLDKEMTMMVLQDRADFFFEHTFGEKAQLKDKRFPSAITSFDKKLKRLVANKPICFLHMSKFLFFFQAPQTKEEKGMFYQCLMYTPVVNFPASLIDVMLLTGDVEDFNLKTYNAVLPTSRLVVDKRLLVMNAMPSVFPK
jgi:hypothetical protein